MSVVVGIAVDSAAANMSVNLMHLLLVSFPLLAFQLHLFFFVHLYQPLHQH